MPAFLCMLKPFYLYLQVQHSPPILHHLRRGLLGALQRASLLRVPDTSQRRADTEPLPLGSTGRLIARKIHNVFELFLEYEW